VNFDARQRGQYLERLASEPFDLLVIGGGITGAGVALDAAGRGLRTALVERGDFAAGTSSRSSKLRPRRSAYLQQKEFRSSTRPWPSASGCSVSPPPGQAPPVPDPGVRLRVAGRAKARTYARGVGMALWMYDVTGGARIGKLHKRLSRRERWSSCPTWTGAGWRPGSCTTTPGSTTPASPSPW